MSILNNLQYQPIQSDLPDDADFNAPSTDDTISLSGDVDERELEQFWDHVVEDVEHDPDWFTFSEE